MAVHSDQQMCGMLKRVESFGVIFEVLRKSIAKQRIG